MTTFRNQRDEHWETMMAALPPVRRYALRTLYCWLDNSLPAVLVSSKCPSRPFPRASDLREGAVIYLELFLTVFGFVPKEGEVHKVQTSSSLVLGTTSFAALIGPESPNKAKVEMAMDREKDVIEKALADIGEEAPGEAPLPDAPSLVVGSSQEHIGPPREVPGTILGTYGPMRDPVVFLYGYTDKAKDFPNQTGGVPNAATLPKEAWIGPHPNDYDDAKTHFEVEFEKLMNSILGVPAPEEDAKKETYQLLNGEAITVPKLQEPPPDKLGASGPLRCPNCRSKALFFPKGRDNVEVKCGRCSNVFHSADGVR